MSGGRVNESSVTTVHFGVVSRALWVGATQVGVNKDSYLILDTLPAEYDARVKAMEVDEKPTEDYSDIGGLDKQIQELVRCPMCSPDGQFALSRLVILRCFCLGCGSAQPAFTTLDVFHASYRRAAAPSPRRRTAVISGSCVANARSAEGECTSPAQGQSIGRTGRWKRLCCP
jgi:hypothetical protein